MVLENEKMIERINNFYGIGQNDEVDEWFDENTKFDAVHGWTKILSQQQGKADYIVIFSVLTISMKIN